MPSHKTLGLVAAGLVLVGGGAALLHNAGSDSSGMEKGMVHIEHPGYKEGRPHSEQGWEKIRGTVQVDLTTSGPIERIEFYLGNRLIHTEDDGSWEWTLDTTPHEDCMYKFTAKAYGTDGSVDQHTTQIWIDNTGQNCM